MRFAPGSRLGAYEIEAPLGEGGMGEVYRATDKRLGRKVAIKILSGRLTENRRASSRFEREARAVAALTHPNILSIYEFEAEGDTPFVVTELLEGKTLRERMDARIPWRKAAEIGAAIADGLAAAHARGITHRDLKPENVFLTNDGRVKILDFGIAHMKRGADGGVPSDTEPTAEFRADAPLGTVGYVSPEQIRCEEPAPTSDLFSLGIVLFEMIAGRNPFARPTGTETLAAILNDEAPPLRSTVPDVPQALERLIGRCLEKRAAERFQSARDLAFELRELARDTGGIATARRRRAGTAAAVALLSFAGFLVLTETRVAHLVGSANAPIMSVAILPLTNGATDPSVEYVADGLTEALINRLSEIPDLEVVGRPVVFQYKNSPRSPIEIARELGVSAVVTGRVEINGDRLALQVDVTDAESRAQLWGEVIDRPTEHMPAIPGIVAKKIAKELRLKLSREEREHVARAATPSALAYDVYLRGMDALTTQSYEGREKAIRYFKQAIELDPQFARAHAALGQTYALYSVNTDPGVMRASARAATARALELDPNLAEAHFARGLLHYFDWDLDGAEIEFRRAIELNGHLAMARSFYASLLMYRGWFEPAIAEARRAREADPTSRYPSLVLINALIHAERLDEAKEEATRLVAVAPSVPASHYMMGRVYAARGEEAAGCGEFVRARELAQDERGEVETLRAACGAGGLEAYRRALIPILQRGELAVEAFEIAATYAALGEIENAWHYLEIAYEERSGGILAIGIDPVFEPLRRDPRVRSLLTRAGLLGKIGMRAERPLQAQVLPGGGAGPREPVRPPSGD